MGLLNWLTDFTEGNCPIHFVFIICFDILYCCCRYLVCIIGHAIAYSSDYAYTFPKAVFGWWYLVELSLRSYYSYAYHHIHRFLPIVMACIVAILALEVLQYKELHDTSVAWRCFLCGCTLFLSRRVVRSGQNAQISPKSIPVCMYHSERKYKKRLYFILVRKQSLYLSPYLYVCNPLYLHAIFVGLGVGTTKVAD